MRGIGDFGFRISDCPKGGVRRVFANAHVPLATTSTTRPRTTPRFFNPHPSTGSGRRSAIRIPKLLLLLVVASLAATSNDELQLKSAGSIEGMTVNGKFVTTLRDNVVFVYDSVTLRCDQAQWWKVDGRIKATGNIDIFKADQRLTCDRVDYTRNDNMITGSGNVVFIDRHEGVKLTGKSCRYNLRTKACVLDGSPRVFRFDTTSAETLTIASKKMFYDDSLKRTDAVGSVKITKGPLVSLSDTARYFTESEIAHLRREPHITYEKHTLTGDSVDLTFLNDTLRGISVDGATHGVYLDEAVKDTTRTQVWGDSMYMALNDSGTLDTVWVLRDVKSTFSPVADTATANTVTGKIMVLAFGGKQGNVEHAQVTGNATSTYFLDDKQGRNEASGDTLTVWFNEGRAQRLRLAGGVRGTYFPTEEKATRPPASAKGAK